MTLFCIFCQNCSLLIKTVEESGGIMREIRDLEDQVGTWYPVEHCVYAVCLGTNAAVAVVLVLCMKIWHTTLASKNGHQYKVVDICMCEVMSLYYT